MMNPPRNLHALLALALVGCGGRTVRSVPVDASIDVAEVEPPPIDVAIDQAAVEDVPVVEASVDTGPRCYEGLPCTEGIPACRIGRTRCALTGMVCGEAGNEPPGTACRNGTCDGRGTCLGPEQRSCPSPSETGCGLVYLLGGTFTLGSPEAYRSAPVQPRTTVGAYALDAYEVTVARFQRFVEAGAPRPTEPIMYPGGAFEWTGRVAMPDTATNCNWNDPARLYHPVNCVDWNTAHAFCAWDGGRLPTEAEWEFAARHQPSAGLNAGRVYPWGDAAPGDDCDRAHWNRCPGDDMAATRRVGRFAPSAGLHDLAGNVWEWTADVFAPYTDGTCWGGAARANPRCPTSASGYPAIRGGSWYTVERLFLRGASRDDAYNPTTRSPLVGFRCARTRTM